MLVSKWSLSLLPLHQHYAYCKVLQIVLYQLVIFSLLQFVTSFIFFFSQNKQLAIQLFSQMIESPTSLTSQLPADKASAVLAILFYASSHSQLIVSLYQSSSHVNLQLLFSDVLRPLQLASSYCGLFSKLRMILIHVHLASYATVFSLL